MRRFLRTALTAVVAAIAASTPLAAQVTVSIAGAVPQIHDLLTAKMITPAEAEGAGGRNRSAAGPMARTTFTFTVLPHSYMAFAPEVTVFTQKP